MQQIDSRAILDDFDPFVDEIERAELGESRVLVKDELYMPVHPSRDWIKCFVTSTQQDGFRMYLEGSGRRFLLSAKSFDVGKYYISGYEGFPNIDTKPKCGYVARVERQRDSSYLVCLDYCHLCDQKLGIFCCGRSKTEREVVAKITHSVKRYRKVNMEFRCITVTIPTISKSGTRKVWCPRSFRKVNSSLPNSADVHEALTCTPKMGMKLVSKLPEWNEDANNLVVRFQGSGRILVASAKNFLLYEEKYSVLDFGEQSMSHIEEDKDRTSKNSNATSGKFAASGGNVKQSSGLGEVEFGDAGHTQTEHSEQDAVDLEAIGGSMKGSPTHSTAASRVSTVSSKNIEKLKLDSVVRTTTSSEAGDEASRSSSKASGRRKDKGEKGGERKMKRVSSRRRMGDGDSQSSNSPKATPRTTATCGSISPRTPRSIANSSQGGSQRREKKEKEKATVDAVERSVLQFGKSTATRFVLDFKYPLSPIQAFGIAISAFASDEMSNSTHEVNHMNSPVLVSRKQFEYARSRSNTAASLSSQTHSYSPLKSPFPS